MFKGEQETEIYASTNPIGLLMANCSDDELRVAFFEIADFRKTGILKGTVLREMNLRVTDITRDHPSQNLRITEDAVLFEIGRRFYNLRMLDKDSPQGIQE